MSLDEIRVNKADRFKAKAELQEVNIKLREVGLSDSEKFRLEELDQELRDKLANLNEKRDEMMGLAVECKAPIESNQCHLPPKSAIECRNPRKLIPPKQTCE